MSIKVTNITKEYGSQRALDNVSFDITKGEIVGFLGPNGAGKSTMMKILTTFIKATDGMASVNHIDVDISSEGDARGLFITFKVDSAVRSASTTGLFVLIDVTK